MSTVPHCVQNPVTVRHRGLHQTAYLYQILEQTFCRIWTALLRICQNAPPAPIFHPAAPIFIPHPFLVLSVFQWPKIKLQCSQSLSLLAFKILTMERKKKNKTNTTKQTDLNICIIRLFKLWSDAFEANLKTIRTHFVVQRRRKYQQQHHQQQ